MNQNTKLPFDIDQVLDRIANAVQKYPQAGLFELVDEGYSTPFELLVACIISIRTRDEVMIPTARSLFGRARTPEQFSQMTPNQIEQLIRSSAFAENKARQIHEIARQLVAEHGGQLPCDEQLMLSFRGVGPKCTNLVMGIGCDHPRIGVDVHVHRITNRWGYVQTRTPEQTMVELEKKLPRNYWVEINRVLVPFGKHICTGSRPTCDVCPVSDMCLRVGVS